MKTKQELIELGMYPNRRADVFYMVGYMYDFIKDEPRTMEEINNKVEELRDKLDKNRDLIDNYDGPIALPKTIFRTLNENFNFHLKENNDKKEIEEKEKDINHKTGVYGIYIEDDLVYIGKTSKSFKDRFNSHMREIKNNTDTMLYNNLRKAKEQGLDVSLKPLIVAEDIKIEGKSHFTKTDIKVMELTLITYFQPRYNVEGRFIPYNFRHN